MKTKIKKAILKITPDFVYEKYRDTKANKHVTIYNKNSKAR